MRAVANILLLADTGHVATAVSDHIQAIVQDSPFNWVVENPLLCKVLHKIDLSQFDAIGIHYSLRPHLNYYLPAPLKKAIAQFKGSKFIFLQDEHRYGNDTIATLKSLQIDLMFTLVTPPYYEKAYPSAQLPNLKKITVLTAYAPSSLKDTNPIPMRNRTLDIFYRSREVPYWLGELAHEKIKIADGIQQRASQYQLNIDVSVKESDRIYGEQWIQKICSSRAVLGTESGTSIWDATGEIEDEVKKFLNKNPKASFEETQKIILQPYEGKIYYATLSPRVFEAAALRTAMILFPGYYNGIMEANVHYIPLNKDFSNFAEVVEKLKDDNYLEMMIERTYQDLIASGRYDQSLLAKTVTEQLSLLLAKTSPFHCTSSRGLSAGSMSLQEKLNSLKKKYRFRNFIYCSIAETNFIIANFFMLLFDKQYTGRDKAKTLWNGAKRYLTYITTRVFRQNSI